MNITKLNKLIDEANIKCATNTKAIIIKERNEIIKNIDEYEKLINEFESCIAFYESTSEKIVADNYTPFNDFLFAVSHILYKKYPHFQIKKITNMSQFDQLKTNKDRLNHDIAVLKEFTRKLIILNGINVVMKMYVTDVIREIEIVEDLLCEINKLQMENKKGQTFEIENDENEKNKIKLKIIDKNKISSFAFLGFAPGVEDIIGDFLKEV